MLLAGALLSADNAGGPGKSAEHAPHLMRSEPWPAAATALAAPAEELAPHVSVIRREPATETPVVKERPSEWGSAMRREPVPVLPAAASHPQEWGQYMRKETRPVLAAGAAQAAERPEHWGSIIRREPRPSVAAVALAAERPQHWGSIIRREPRPSAVVPLGSAQGATVAVGGLSGSTIARFVVGAVVLIGFAMQVQSMFAELLKGAKGEAYNKGKGK